MKRALFLDRDGTVTREVGYVNHPERLELLPRTAEAIALARAEGWLCVLATNQAGVARGYFDEELVSLTHGRLQDLLEAQGTRLDAIYYCPHHPAAGAPPYRAACDCRKPGTGMLLAAERDLGVSLAASAVIGDKNSDVELAHRVDAIGIMVRTGYGLGEEVYRRDRWKAPPDHMADDLLDAVRWLLLNTGGSR